MRKHWSEKRGWTFFPRQLRYTQPMQKGRDVTRWQRFLSSIGYSVVADGIFGPNTEAMTRRYLKRDEYVILGRYTRYKLYLMKWLLDKLMHMSAPRGS